MAETLTSIQIPPRVRDELRKEKAELSAVSGRSVDYGDMVLELLLFWRKADQTKMAPCQEGVKEN